MGRASQVLDGDASVINALASSAAAVQGSDVTDDRGDSRGEARRPVTVYLDTSDLSYLVKGRGPGGVDVSPTRDRLLALLATERARLFVSLVHFAEMAIDDGTAEAAIRWVDTGPPIWCFTTSAEAIFRAELLGESLSVNLERLTRAGVASMRLRLRAPLPGVAAGTVARGVRQLADVWGKAEAWSQRAAARPPGTTAREHAMAKTERRRVAERVLRGEHHGLPWVARAAASVLIPFSRWAAARHGLTLEDVRAHGGLPPGCSWFAGCAPPDAWRAAAQRVKSSPADAPASALRVAIAAGGPTRPGALYDVQHLAYAARCDFATIDGPNFRATQRVRAKLARPTFFPTAHLDEVVRAVRDAADSAR